METQNLQEKVPYKDFVVGPHCQAKGKNGFLWRLCGLPPSISRSDGESYHLFLNDRPSRYPMERKSQNQGKIFVGFSYIHDNGRDEISTTGVIFNPGRQIYLNLQIRDVADALSSELRRSFHLETLYDLTGDLYRPPRWASRVLSLWNVRSVPAVSKEPGKTLPTRTYVRRKFLQHPRVVI
jgi:hypothetical protein